MPETDAHTSANLPAGFSCDVAVVGYGPVGQCLAGLLALQGVSVAVFERYPSLCGRPRAGHFDGETMRTFQRLGVASDMELISRPLTSYECVTPDWEVLERHTLGEGTQGWKASYLFYQPELEDVLDARARELGVQIFMGMTAIGLRQHPDGVELTVSNAHGAEATVNASIVVGADGANSFIRQALRVTRQDLGFPAVSNLVLDFEHANPDRDIPRMGDVRQVLDVKRPRLSGRWNGARWSRWEFLQMPGETREYLERDDTCWQLLASWDVTPVDGEIIRRSVYTFESTIADQWRVGRALLVGDAAHTTPPFMGQGMCSGIRDAANLAWKLTAALQSKAGLDLLDTYQAERSPQVRAIIEMAMEIGNNVVITDPQLRRQADDAMRRSKGEEQKPFPRLGCGPLSPLRADDDGGVEGRPAIQARVAQGRRVDRIDSFLRAGWKIVSRHPLPDALFNSRQLKLLSGIDAELVHVSRGATGDGFVDIDAEFDLWFRHNQSKAFIQRPDNYIFGAVQTIEELPPLVDELETALTNCGWRIDASGGSNSTGLLANAADDAS